MYHKAADNQWKLAKDAVTSGDFFNLFPSLIVPFPAVVTHSQLVLVRLVYQTCPFAYTPVFKDPKWFTDLVAARDFLLWGVLFAESLFAANSVFQIVSVLGPTKWFKNEASVVKAVEVCTSFTTLVLAKSSAHIARLNQEFVIQKRGWPLLLPCLFFDHFQVILDFQVLRFFHIFFGNRSIYFRGRSVDNQQTLRISGSLT
jgi:hypothetical protein